MTAIKASVESKIILDFSKGEFSKNKIKQALRQCEVIHSKRGSKPNEVTVFTHHIKVGMYTIGLMLLPDSSPNWTRLKQYGDFEVLIWDTNNPKVSAIPLKKDPRFKDQYWVSKNTFGQLRIKHLIDIIAYCHRLNKLRAFL
jgi:hypothetical protein